MNTSKQIQSMVEELSYGAREQIKTWTFYKDADGKNVLNLTETQEIIAKTLTTLANTIHEESIREAQKSQAISFKERYPNEWYHCCGAGENIGYNRAFQDIINYHKGKLGEVREQIK